MTLGLIKYTSGVEIRGVTTAVVQTVTIMTWSYINQLTLLSRGTVEIATQSQSVFSGCSYPVNKTQVALVMS